MKYINYWWSHSSVTAITSAVIAATSAAAAAMSARIDININKYTLRCNFYFTFNERINWNALLILFNVVINLRLIQWIKCHWNFFLFFFLFVNVFASKKPNFNEIFFVVYFNKTKIIKTKIKILKKRKSNYN